MAKSGGGNLLVISDTDEAVALKAMAAHFARDAQVWLGASLEGSLWTWITGERWTSASWADDSQVIGDDYALYIRSSGAWEAMDRSETASGFIIEWSSDAKSSGGKTNHVNTPAEDAAALLVRAKGLIIAADKNYKEALAANVKKIGWDLDAYLRGLSKGDQAHWSSEVEQMKSCVDGNRILIEKLHSGDGSYTAEMLKLANYHTAKQAEIDKQYADAAVAIRDAFVTKLTEIRAKVEASGQPKLAAENSELIDSASNLDSWLDSFGVTPAPPKPSSETKTSILGQ